ncbi:MULTISPECIES: hypothetical protein [unclassified Burkholderia]|uniref:hypothetical protein n=1 Tax=unclassified Burkholderia TaxID=2613784 RepID=UPI000A8FCB20|nr:MULTISPECIES: hypothetical protein [unclassified Burkholderia]
MAYETINVADLRNKFNAGATPSEDDYQNLISLAAVGSRALGADQNNATEPKPGNGLTLDADSKLAVKEGTGIQVNADGVAVKVDNATVKVDETSKALAVKLKTDTSGLDTTGGLHVKTGPGVTVGSSGLTIARADKSGLSVANNKLSVDIASTKSGLDFNESGALVVKVDPAEGNFIEKKDGGLAINADGIKAIGDFLKNVSIKALDAADKNTSHGFKKDVDEKAQDHKSIEYQISEKLNVAYAEGWNLQQAMRQLAALLKEFKKNNENKFVKNSVISLSGFDVYLNLYARGGAPYTKKQLKMACVGADGRAAWVESVQDQNIQNIDSGIYAVVGIVSEKGFPDERGEHYTQQAVMVVAGKADKTDERVMAVVGGWDFNGDWGRDVGAWHYTPTIDPCPAYNVDRGVLDVSGVDIDEFKWGDLVKSEYVKNNLSDALVQTIASTDGIVKTNIEKKAYDGSDYGREWRQKLGKHAYDWYDEAGKKALAALRGETQEKGALDYFTSAHTGEDAQQSIASAVKAMVSKLVEVGYAKWSNPDSKWSNTQKTIASALVDAYKAGSSGHTHSDEEYNDLKNEFDKFKIDHNYTNEQYDKARGDGVKDGRAAVLADIKKMLNDRNHDIQWNEGGSHPQKWTVGVFSTETREFTKGTTGYYETTERLGNVLTEIKNMN